MKKNIFCIFVVASLLCSLLLMLRFLYSEDQQELRSVILLENGHQTLIKGRLDGFKSIAIILSCCGLLIIIIVTTSYGKRKGKKHRRRVTPYPPPPPPRPWTAEEDQLLKMSTHARNQLFQSAALDPFNGTRTGKECQDRLRDLIEQAGYPRYTDPLKIDWDEVQK